MTEENIDESEMRENVPYLLREILHELVRIRKALYEPVTYQPMDAEEIERSAKIAYETAVKTAKQQAADAAIREWQMMTARKEGRDS